MAIKNGRMNLTSVTKWQYDSRGLLSVTEWVSNHGVVVLSIYVA